MSLIGLLKSHGTRLPRPIGNLLAKIPYSIRPGFGRAYRQADLTRRWFEETATAGERREFVFDRVRAVVKHAVDNVPFYRRFYAENGFSLSDLRSFDDIASIPMTSKKILQDVPLEERSCKRPGRTTTYTGGSTGEPFQFYSDSQQIGNEWAHMHFIWSKLGFRDGDLLLSVSLDSDREPVYYDALRHSVSLNIHYPREEIVRAFLALPKRRRRVKFFRGYPSAFSEFLEYCETHAPHAISELRETLLGSFLASEFPLPVFRETIERATERPTISWYGLSERCVLAEEVRPYVYSPFQSYGYCETATDSSGFTSLVGTSYFNYASPLIRYRIDDGVNPVDMEDGMLKAFEIHEGRAGDYLVDKNGEKFSITHLNLSCRRETWELARCVQVEQREPGRAIIWVTPRRSAEIAEIEQAFAFDDLNLECEFRTTEKPFVSKRGKVLLKIGENREV